MKFRTEIDHTELSAKIDYGTNILALGSCFAQSIAERLSAAKFRIELCPTGILFNPASIADTLLFFASQSPAERSRFVERSEGWVSLDSHSDLARPTIEEAISALESATARGHQALQSAQCVIITFGTAWVYRHNDSGKIVANCHKVPQSEFTRFRLSVEEIVALYKPLFEGILSDKQVIFTLSPVRHTADGLAENSLSKATLRVAIAELCALYPNAEYFPAYEIVTDDLRDYRFYADDLVHPSHRAVEYIWEHFTKAALSPRAQALLPRVKQVVDAAAHRPSNPTSEAYRNFCSRYLQEAKAIAEVDFSDECAIFERYSVKS
ncbi:MAG: GSCFA domain-containing protein [Alistipes sp.]|nr:GSCFA domain-containing protein [Alistipes sp.]